MYLTTMTFRESKELKRSAEDWERYKPQYRKAKNGQVDQTNSCIKPEKNEQLESFKIFSI